MPTLKGRESEIIDFLARIARNSGRPPRESAIADSFRGLSITGRSAGILPNTENNGYTFFTRPRMNLSKENLVIDRVLSSLLRDDVWSIQHMIRMYLDPDLVRGEQLRPGGIDNNNPFIPLLTNNLISISGWPDFTIGTHTSKPGLYRDAYSYVDDVPYSYETYDLQATFRNIDGDPISFMFLMWCWYQGLVYEGRVMPHLYNVNAKRLDYTTRVYRLVMDKTRTYVTKMGSTGASFPISVPIASSFDQTGDGSETPFPNANDQITISLRSTGFRYYDHIQVFEFNWLVKRDNPGMRSADPSTRRVVGGREMSGNDSTTVYWKLYNSEKQYFDYMALPFINELTMELEWWVPFDPTTKL